MNYLEDAIELLRNGEVIASRTDTVYGLLADATNDNAVRKSFILKQRPFSKSLIVLVNSIEMAKEIANMTQKQEEIAKELWIEKRRTVTLIFKLKLPSFISRFVFGEKDTIAIRLPRDKFCLDLINGLDHPIIAPSANISDHPTAITAQMVKEDFGDKIPLIIDEGNCTALPSEIIDLTQIIPVRIR